MTSHARIPGNEELLKGVSFRRVLSNHLRDDGYLPEPWVFPPIFSFRRSTGGLNGDFLRRPQAVVHAPKSGPGWRDFALFHPNNYLAVVGALGTKEFESAFRNAAAESRVTAFSIPQIYASQSQRVRQDLERWGRMQAAIRTLAHSHPFIGLSDVSSCYHTVYSHAVAWALDESMDPGNEDVGNRLDRALRGANLGRTHGIAVGPRVSDFVVELLLLHVDGTITLPRNVKAFRFRDNYYFLGSRERDIQRSIAELSKALREAHLRINASKTETKHTRDYVTRSWRHDYKTLCYTVGVNIDAIDDGMPTALRASTVAGFLNGAILLSADHEFQHSVAERAIADLERSGYAAGLPDDRVLDLMFILARTRPKVLPFALSFLLTYAAKHAGPKRRVRNFIVEVAIAAKNAEDWFSFSWSVYFHQVLTGRPIRASVCAGVTDPFALCVIEHCALVSSGQDVTAVKNPLWERIPKRERGRSEYDSGERAESGFKLVYAEPLDADEVAALLGPRFNY
jgi:hypothetical protein